MSISWAHLGVENVHARIAEAEGKVDFLLQSFVYILIPFGTHFCLLSACLNFTHPILQSPADSPIARILHHILLTLNIHLGAGPQTLEFVHDCG